MRSFNDRFRIDTKRAAKGNMRERDQASGFVDLRENALEGNDYAVIRRNNLNPCTETPLSVPDVFPRRKIKRAGDDFVASGSRELETGGDTGQRNRSIWLDLYRTRRCSQHARDTIAYQLRKFPPARGPGVFARVTFPGIAIGNHRITRGTRHRTKTVAKQMHARSQRGKFFTTTIERFLGRHRSYRNEPLVTGTAGVSPAFSLPAGPAK